MIKRFVCIFLFLCLSPLGAWAERDSLLIALMLEDGAARTTFYRFAKEFEAMHPDLDVNLWVSNDAGYKAEVKNLLMSEDGPDVVYWQGGRSLERFAAQDLIVSIDDLWQDNHWNENFSPHIKKLVSVEGEAYGLPYSYYPWGFYYRKSVFAAHNLRPPETWQDFLRVCEALKENNIVPIAIGTKHSWTSGGWFDYLNLRLNGLDFHQDLLKGLIPFTDTRVVELFKVWKVLLENDIFLPNHSDLSWRESIPYVYRGMAGMTLIGNFVVASLPEAIIEDVGFFRFPVMDAKQGRYEEAPTDVLMVAKKSKNKAMARGFLKLMADAQVMASLNVSLGTISPHKQSSLPELGLTRQGLELLARADGYSQYFDRDSSSEFAKISFEVLVKFMADRDLEQVIQALESARLDFLDGQ